MPAYLNTLVAIHFVYSFINIIDRIYSIGIIIMEITHSLDDLIRVNIIDGTATANVENRRLRLISIDLSDLACVSRCFLLNIEKNSNAKRLAKKIQTLEYTWCKICVE